MNLLKLWRNLPLDTSELLIGLLFSVPAAWIVGQHYGTPLGVAMWTALYLLSLIWQAVRRLITVLTISQTMDLRHQAMVTRLDAAALMLEKAQLDMAKMNTAKDHPTP